MSPASLVLEREGSAPPSCVGGCHFSPVFTGQSCSQPSIATLWLLLLTIIARRFHSPRKATSRHTLSLDKSNPGPQARQAFPTAADPLLGFSFGNRHPRQGGGDWDGGNGVLAWFGDACRDALHPIPAIKNCRVSCVSCIEVFKMLLQLTGG